MATQLADTHEPIEAADEQRDEAQTPRDFEAEAKLHGWTPKEDFKGDPSRWSDAETFVRRADEVMPLLKKKTDAQDRRIKDLEKTIRDQATHFSKLEDRAFQRAVTDLKQKQLAAVEAGDVAAHEEISKKIDDLKADITPPKAANDIELEAKEAAIDWREKNPWYDKGGLARDYADLLVEKHKNKTADMAPADFFDYIGQEVLKRYPNAAAPARREAINPVEGAGNRGVKGKKSFSDLPAAAQAACDRMIRNKVPITREKYVADYDWSN